MLKRLLALVPELKRLRLSSIDVAEIDDELFALMAHEPRLMPHIHISLQAGDNMILKRMKRRHNREQIIDFCNSLRSKRPETSFGADIIAGFPTETDEMFANTRKLISEAGLQYLHVFPFSEREGTPAAKMPQVSMDIRKQRAAILREEGVHELQKFFKQNIGKYVELLMEQHAFAHTENFIPVKLEDGDYIPGEIIKAKLIGIDENHMIARRV
jgi:threonylcarbamoyladenosine tRNA methylthiotransferase MtaB